MSMTSIWDLSSHLNELILVWFANVPVRQFSCWHQRNFYGFYTGVIWQRMSLCVGLVIVCSELSDISDRRELLLWLDIHGNGTFCRHSRGPMFTLCISFSAALTPLVPAAQNTLGSCFCLWLRTFPSGRCLRSMGGSGIASIHSSRRTAVTT